MNSDLLDLSLTVGDESPSELSAICRQYAETVQARDDFLKGKITFDDYLAVMDGQGDLCSVDDFREDLSLQLTVRGF